MIEKSISLLQSRGFCAISIIVDPFGSGDTTYLSITHKEFMNELRFLVMCDDLHSLCESMNQLVKMHDERQGQVWKLPNTKRIALSALPSNKILIQGTEAGINIAKKLLGMKITDAAEIREAKKPVQLGD